MLSAGLPKPRLCVSYLRVFRNTASAPRPATPKNGHIAKAAMLRRRRSGGHRRRGTLLMGTWIVSDGNAQPPEAPCSVSRAQMPFQLRALHAAPQPRSRQHSVPRMWNFSTRLLT